MFYKIIKDLLYVPIYLHIFPSLKNYVLAPSPTLVYTMNSMTYTPKVLLENSYFHFHQSVQRFLFMNRYTRIFGPYLSDRGWRGYAMAYIL